MTVFLLGDLDVGWAVAGNGYPRIFLRLHDITQASLELGSKGRQYNRCAEDNGRPGSSDPQDDYLQNATHIWSGRLTTLRAVVHQSP